MRLSHSKNLIKTLDFTGAPNLEELILDGCKRLREIHSSLLVNGKLILLKSRKLYKSYNSSKGDCYWISSKTYWTSDWTCVFEFKWLQNSCETSEYNKWLEISKNCKSLSLLQTWKYAREFGANGKFRGARCKWNRYKTTRAIHFFSLKNFKGLPFRGYKGPPYVIFIMAFVVPL